MHKLTFIQVMIESTNQLNTTLTQFSSSVMVTESDSPLGNYFLFCF